MVEMRLSAKRRSLILAPKTWAGASLSPAKTLHTKNIPDSRLRDDSGPGRLALREYLVPHQRFQNVNSPGTGGDRKGPKAVLRDHRGRPHCSSEWKPPLSVVLWALC